MNSMIDYNMLETFQIHFLSDSNVFNLFNRYTRRKRSHVRRPN